MFKKFIVFLIAVQLSAGTAWAQVQDPALYDRPAGASASDVSRSADIPSSELLYLDFRGASLLNVLTVLSKISGINFVTGKEVAAREINMVLDDVTLQDALTAISKSSNVVYEHYPERNIYLFRAAADAEDEPPLETRVFKLYYIRVSQMRQIAGGSTGGTSGGGSSGGSSGGGDLEEDEAELESAILTIIENILSERGRVNVDDRSNSLIVTDTEDRLRMVEQAIVELDHPLDQVLIHVILIETFEDLARHLGIEWFDGTDEGAFGTITGGSARTRFPFNTDIFRKDLFDKDALSLGTPDVITTAPTGTTFGTKNFSDFTIKLKALQTAQRVRVLAKPKILVLDNHPALIKITTDSAVGEETVGTTVGQSATSTSTTTERSETGTSLRVTPLINTNGRITMTVEPRFATVSSSAIVTSKGDTTIRTARTTLMVNDGQTIVLGGLLQSQQTQSERKVPFLGDLPAIGEIFRKRTTDMEDRELILFITPNIIRDPSQAKAISIPDERLHFDDEKAPFWKVKRKEWYRNLRLEAGDTDETDEAGVDALARQKLMDSALEDLSRGLKEGGNPANLSDSVEIKL